MPRASKEAAQIPAIAEDQPAAEAAPQDDTLSQAAVEETSQAEDLSSSPAGQQDSLAELQEPSVAESVPGPAFTESQADMAESAYGQDEVMEGVESQAELAEEPAQALVTEQEQSEAAADQEPAAEASQQDFAAEMSQQDTEPEQPEVEQPPPQTQPSSRPAYKPSETFSQVLDSLQVEIAESGAAPG